MTVGRSITAHDRLVTPPDRVWDRIAGELGLREHAAEPTAATEATGRPHLTAVPAPAATLAPGPTGAPTHRRWYGTAALATAAATAGLLVGLGSASRRVLGRPAFTRLPGPGDPTVQAQVSLQPLGDIRAAGQRCAHRAVGACASRSTSPGCTKSM